MSSKLPPVPFQTPMIDEGGNLNQLWADFFNKLRLRVGGGTAETNLELYNITAERIPDDSISFDKMQNIVTDSLMGRDSASTGSPESISVGGGIEFTGSGALRTSEFTGDVTKAAGGTSTTISNNAVSFIKQLSTDWTKNTAASGYTKLPNGIYIQWGVTASIASGTNTSVNFPTAFPNACRQVVAGIQGNSAGATGATGHFGTGNYSTTAFDLYNRTSAAYTFNYLAVGF